MTPYIDTHCHLDLFPDIKSVVAKEDGSDIKSITVTNAPFLWRPNTQLFLGRKNIRVALGFHPELASDRGHEISIFKEVISEARYIGEIGLDGSSQIKEKWEDQLRVFREVLKALQNQEKKIITVHSRNAAAKTVEELNKVLANTPHKVILHWFSGSKAELQMAIDSGFYFSINHKMATSKKGNSIIKEIPKDKMLTETDAPFTFGNNILNRLQSLELTVGEVAKIWSLPFNVTKEIIWNNFKCVLKE